MRVFTLGFTEKTAEKFFELLKASGATKVIDIRINRVSQLAGFAKEQDLRFFIPKLTGVEYLVREDLAPSKELLASYRDGSLEWNEFAEKYQELLEEREVPQKLSEYEFADAVLLCSENEPYKCHRTLIAQLLVEKYPNIEIINLI